MQNHLKDLLQIEINKIIADVVKLRHKLHTIPEVSFNETLTTQLIIEELHKAGVDKVESPLQTGAIGILSGTKPGHSVAIRADIDALRIQEKTMLPYASQHHDRSHACGHDGHIACVLGTARVLSTLREHLHGDLRLIFQPGEEAGTGAQSFIAAGALGSPLPSAILTLHSWPGIECGCVASKPDYITSWNDVFTLTINGKGGHGARPNECSNPIISCSKIIQTVINIPSTLNEVTGLTTVSIGMVRSGNQPNIIPDDAIITGTIRSSDNATRSKVLNVFKKAVQNIANDDKVRVNIDFHTNCPPVWNHPDLYHLFTVTADEYLNTGKRIVLHEQSLGSEDFSYYTQHVPGFLIRLGMGSESPSLHSSLFDFCDDALKSGIMMLSSMILKTAMSNFQITGYSNETFQKE